VLSSKTSWSRFLLFGGLYFAQGVPWGFITIALQIRLARLGLTPGALGGVLTVAVLPFAAKPLLGPLVDRLSFGRLGRRRPFVLLAEAGMAATLLLLTTVDPSRSLRWFSMLVLVHNTFAAIQDVGVDALALDVLDSGERGRANGIMVAGKYAGIVVGGQGMVWLASRAGWSVATGTAVILLLVPATLILRLREAPASAAGASVGPLLRRSFLTRIALLTLVFAFVFDVSDSLTAPMMIPLLQRTLGYTDQRIAALITMAALSSVVGSLIGGLMCDRLGRRRALLVACLVVAATDFIFVGGHAAWTNTSFVLTLSVAGALASGMVLAAAVTLFMDLTNPRVVATQFQVYMSVMNLRASTATTVGGHLAERFSAPFMFVLGGVLELVPLALLPFLDARRAQSEFARDDPPRSADSY
jgi:MFS transporter, PAT family, beta-lactamase induction signal transducer AmpG